jgi:non-ribosomal peptide synthetase component F/thioesterase domain-containing protein
MCEMTVLEQRVPLLADSATASGASEDVFVLPTSLGQERFWGLDRMKPGNPTWAVPVRFRLLGALNIEFVRRAFNEIVRRHEVLRTIFSVEDGKPVQIIRPSLRIDVPVTDLRHLPKPERDAEMDRLSFQEARRGFDLSVGPLFRATLLQVEDNEHVLMVTPHHTVADYWSIGLVSNELGALYEAYARGSNPALPELPIQYGDYSIWQRDQAEGPTIQSELAYWKSQLKDLPLLEFPTDHPRQALPTYEATITSILLPVGLTDAIKEIANREGATFFNTMLAALAMVMRQYSGQEDFGVATQVAGRANVELEPLIGLFINTVILRMDLSGDPSFSTLVNRVQDTNLHAIANQEVRFEQLLKELRPKDYPSHHNLFRLNFICQRDPVKPQEFSGIKLTVIPSKCQGALYELNVFLVSRNEGWRLACEYNTDLFDAATITQLLNNYRSMLECIAQNPNRKLSEFPVPAELAGLLRSKSAERNSQNSANTMTSSSIVPTHSLGAAVLEPATLIEPGVSAEDFFCASAPERYVMPASVAQERFWTLEELAPCNPALHMRACVRLTGKLSVNHLEKSLQSLVARHETLRTTFERTGHELAQVISSSLSVSLPVTSLEDVSEADQAARLQDAIREEASAAFDLVHGPLFRARLFRLGDQHHILVISTHHILVDGWSQSIIQRDLWSIYQALTEGREPSLAPLTIQYSDFVHWQQEWLSSREAQQQLEFWKKQLAAPPPALNFSSRKPDGHGSASEPMETLLLSDDLAQGLKNFGQSHDATMFMVLAAGFAVLLSRCTGQTDILIGSPVAHRRPETEPLIGPFAGPVPLRVDLSGDPTLLELVSRVRDSAVNALSHADIPFEVILKNLDSSSLRGRNPLSQCYFFYQTAFLQPRSLGELTVAPLRDFGLGTHFELQMGLLERQEGIRAQLEYNPALFDPATVQLMLVDYHRILETMIENPNLKVAELALSSLQPRVQDAPKPESAHFDVAFPQDDTERKLKQIWGELLGIRSIGIDQNYFELGGNSILAVRLFNQIETVFQVRLPLSTLLEAPTIRELARVLNKDVSAPSWSPIVPMQTKGARPPFFCVHAAGGNVFLYRDLSRHLGDDQPFYGLQYPGLNGEQPLLTRIEDMAAFYVREIRTVQSHGPYYLGGYCLGGTIALEMAQQLTSEGEEVALLALFDTLNWSKILPYSLWGKTYHQGERILFHARNFALLTFKDKVKFFKEKLKTLRSRVDVWRGMLFGKLSNDPAATRSESSLLAQVWTITDRAAVKYKAHPYSGRITEFRPLKQYSKYLGTDVYWDRLAGGGYDVITLPVYPAGMLLEPFVRQLAAELKASMDKVTDRPTVAGSVTQ